MTPLPKRRHSSGRAGRRHQGHNRRVAALTELSKCQKCVKVKRPHYACANCEKINNPKK